jgi:hypothetical protein
VNQVRLWRPPPLWLSIYLLVLVMWLGLFYLPLFFGAFPRPIDYLDFSYYYAAAQIGLQHGWNHIYDLDLQRQVFYQLHPTSDPFDWRRYFVSPPPVAWLAAPLTALPLVLAFWIFALTSAVAFALAGWLLVPGRGLGRLAIFLTAAGTYPVLIAIQTGQVVPLVAAAIGLGWWLAVRGHRVAAGLVLVAVLLKPQVGLLVPVALLAAGQRRVFLVWFAGAAALTTIALLSIGPHGLTQLRSDLAAEQGQTANLAWTLVGLVGPGPQAVLVQLLAATGALWVASRHREAGLELPVVAGLLGTLLAAPYHNPSDYAVLAPAAWLHLRTGMSAGRAGVFVLALAGCLLAARFGSLLVLVATGLWLGLLCAEAVRVRDRRGEEPVPAESEVAQVCP